MYRRRKIVLFGLYSYLNNLLFIILDLMPQIIRGLAFKMLLREFGESSFIDYNTKIRYPSKLIIGKNASVNCGCKFYGSFFSKEVIIKIGDGVLIAPDVSFFTAGHNYRYLDMPDIAESIIIEDNVWVGGKSIILPGVKIGKGAVIGAGSVVTTDIPAWTVAVGNPAKVIKKREVISEDKKEVEK